MSGGALSRRTLLQGAVGLAAAGGIAGIVDLARTAGTSRANTTGHLRVGYLPITDAAPLLIAHNTGSFDGNPVSPTQPVMFRSWSSLAEAFMSRHVDVVHLLMPMAVQLRYSLGGAARVLGWNHTNGSALTVAPDITELGQLAGRQVAIPFWWSIHNIVLQKLLRAGGLRPVVRTAPSRSDGTVGLVVMSPSDMLPALANGAIGGYTVADPFNAAAEIKGVGRIHRFLGDVWRDHACCALLVHEDVIDRDPAGVQRLTDAVTSAQLRIDADRKHAAEMLKTGRYLPQPLPAITKALTYPVDAYPVSHQAWQPQRIGYQPFPFPSFTQALVEAMHETEVDGDRRFLSQLDPASVHADLVDDRFVRQSLTIAGGPATFGLPAHLTRTEEVDPT
ncbi:ABC transporter substrate-binding protein [Prescottella equi]|uniref:ABC transporter substrate-binding protein n=1 Tax=Rhodococcus hoagii TaxID=43767 RepID=UPI000A0FC8A1|nr:ABC transporter substrate-binding protein [Prescottella equi]ORM02382.1 ABC transporter substrate-binding protein [Prescottella equi]ORM19923.1 ABC transporter substrate-binding protein [Prescottella equi]QDP11158.1 ABC transporter substrate-binding protein [Prescottella equi]